MKKTLYFSIIFLIITGCAVNKKPVFIKLDTVEVVSFKSDTIRFKAAAIFKNPNDIGGKIFTDKISVIFNGAELAQVSSSEFKVPARNNFTVPLFFVVPTKRVFENNKNGIIGGLLNSILSKTIDVQFKGVLEYKILGFSSVYQIDATQKIKL